MNNKVWNKDGLKLEKEEEHEDVVEKCRGTQWRINVKKLVTILRKAKMCWCKGIYLNLICKNYYRMFLMKRRIEPNKSKRPGETKILTSQRQSANQYRITIYTSYVKRKPKSYGENQRVKCLQEAKKLSRKRKYYERRWMLLMIEEARRTCHSNSNRG